MTKQSISKHLIEEFVENYALLKCEKCNSIMYKLFSSIRTSNRWNNDYKCPNCDFNSININFINEEESKSYLISLIETAKNEFCLLLNKTMISDVLNKILVDLTKELWNEIPILKSTEKSERKRGIDIDQIRSLFYLRFYIKTNINIDLWRVNNWDNRVFNDSVYTQILNLTKDIVYYLGLIDYININSCALYYDSSSNDRKLAINSLYQSINLIFNDFGGVVNMDLHSKFDPKMIFTGDVYSKSRSFLDVDHEIKILLQKELSRNNENLDTSIIQYDLIPMFNQIIAFPSHGNILNLRSIVASGITSKQLLSLFFSAMKVINYNHPKTNRGIQLFPNKEILIKVLNASTLERKNYNKIIFSHDGENRYIKMIKSITDLTQVKDILPLIVAIEELELDNGKKANGYIVDVLYMVLISSFLSQFTNYSSILGRLQSIKGYEIFEKQILPKAFCFLSLGKGAYFTWDEIKINYNKLGFTSIENMKSQIGEIDGIYANWENNELWVIEAKKSNYPLYGWIKKDRIGFNIAKIIGHIEGLDYTHSKISIGQKFPKYYVETLNKTIKTKVKYFEDNKDKLIIFGLDPKNHNNIQIQGFIVTDLYPPIYKNDYQNIKIISLQILLRMVYYKRTGKNIYD